MKSNSAEVLMESPDGESRTEVNNNESVAIMEGLGWKVVGDVKAAKPAKKTDTPAPDAEEVKGDGNAPPPASNTEKSAPAAKDTKPDYSGMTKNDLKELLDAKKIKYDNHATKADLIELMSK